MLDLVGNPEDRFSHNEAHLSPTIYIMVLVLLKQMFLRHVVVFRSSELIHDNYCLAILEI